MHTPEALLAATFPRSWVLYARRQWPGARALQVARALSQALAKPKTVVAIAVGTHEAELELRSIAKRMCEVIGVDMPPNLSVDFDPSPNVRGTEPHSVYFDETCADGEFDRAVNTLRMRSGLRSTW